MTEGPHGIRPAIEAHQAVPARAEPKRSAAVLRNRPDTRRELDIFVALDLSRSPVNPVQAALRTNPQDSLAVFVCRNDRTVYQAVFVAGFVAVMIGTQVGGDRTVRHPLPSYSPRSCLRGPGTIPPRGPRLSCSDPPDCSRTKPPGPARARASGVPVRLFQAKALPSGLLQWMRRKPARSF